MLNDADKGKDNEPILCSWCGQPAQIIWVHGHGQCSYCLTNIEECCRGEQCSNTLPQEYLPGTEIINE
jgi:hypothetical protein